jgi:hypothetical protein
LLLLLVNRLVVMYYLYNFFYRQTYPNVSTTIHVYQPTICIYLKPTSHNPLSWRVYNNSWHFCHHLYYLWCFIALDQHSCFMNFAIWTGNNPYKNTDIQNSGY